MDTYLYYESMKSNKPDTEFVNKEVLYVQDQNANTYSGQITFDTSVLSNSGKWLAYSEGAFQIPFVVSLQNTADITATANAFMAGLKSGFYNIIDSIQVDYNNRNCVQLMSFTNFFVNYKMLSSMSQDALTKHGPSIGMWPDSAGSFVFNAAANANGDGYSNNRDLSTLATFTQPENFNEGFLVRKRNNTAFINGTGYGGIGANLQVSQIGKGNLQNNGAAAAARIYSFVVLATIRLSDICDFFAKLPLIKGGFFRIVINYNSTRHSITTAANSMVIAANGSTVLSGRTCPYLISSATANNSGAVLAPGVGTITVECGVARTSLVSPTIPMNSCRLYVPAYEIAPDRESHYLSTVPKHDLYYTDIYTFSFGTVANTASFNQLITNGIVNPRYLVLIPHINGTGTYANVNIPEYQSPFDTAPATSGPLAALSNFNVLVGGKNLFQQNFQYDFEAYSNEVRAINAINGGAASSPQSTSGLISRYMWDNGYRFYVADLHRRPVIEDNVQKSIQIIGTNVSGVSLDFVCIIVFERKITIDTPTGALLT